MRESVAPGIPVKSRKLKESHEWGPVLPRSFYARETREVARDLLGRVIERGECAGRIVEVEAYLGVDDLAAHSARGITSRTRVIFGEPGHAYVYLIYGIYECLNIVCEPDGAPGCVLIRALEPVDGIASMRARRGVERLEDLMSGPGKLTRAMGITRGDNGADLSCGELIVREGVGGEFGIEVTPRVGITKCADWPLRYLIAGNRFVSR